MRSRRAIRSSGSQACSRRSGPSASATPGASHSTARPATSRSPTSARAPGRRSTSRRADRAQGRSTAGTPSRGPRGSRRSRCPARHTCRRCSCGRIRRATARSRAATSSAPRPAFARRAVRPRGLLRRRRAVGAVAAGLGAGRRSNRGERRQPVELRRGPGRLRLRRLAPGRRLPPDREPRSRRAVRDAGTAPAAASDSRSRDSRPRPTSPATASAAPAPTAADTTPPETTIERGPTARTTNRRVTIVAAASEQARFECSLDGSPFAACATPFTTPPLTEGPHRLDLRAVDAAGNVEPQPASWAWRVDLDPLRRWDTEVLLGRLARAVRSGRRIARCSSHTLPGASPCSCGPFGAAAGRRHRAGRIWPPDRPRPGAHSCDRS